MGVFLNNSNFNIWGIWLLVPCCIFVGGVFPPTPHPTITPILSKWFINDLGNIILYFRKEFQNLPANQKQNHTAPHQCKKYYGRLNISQKENYQKEFEVLTPSRILWFTTKISSKTDFIFAMILFTIELSILPSHGCWMSKVFQDSLSSNRCRTGSDMKQRRSNKNYTGQQHEWTLKILSLSNRGTTWTPPGMTCEVEILWNHCQSWYQFGEMSL